MVTKRTHVYFYLESYDVIRIETKPELSSCDERKMIWFV